MFNVGGGELIVIALIALIVLGPSRLPGAGARQVGKTMSELRRLSSGFQNELRTAFDDAERSSAPAAGAKAPADGKGSMAAAVDAVSSQAAPAARAASAKKAPGKRPAAKKAPAKQTAVKKTPAKKPAATKTAVKKKAVKKKATAKKATARR